MIEDVEYDSMKHGNGIVCWVFPGIQTGFSSYELGAALIPCFRTWVSKSSVRFL